MATTRAKNEGVCEQLVKHAQRVARVLAGASSSGGSSRSQAMTTAVARLQARLKAVDDALSVDLVELARRVAEDGHVERQRLAEQLEALVTQHRDIDQRREELAQHAVGYDWPVAHREKRDYVGPVTVDHTPETASLSIGRCKLLTLRLPSGEEVLQAVKNERARLETLARQLWPEMRERVLALQTGPQAAVLWPSVVKALTPEEGAFRRREPVVLLMLAMLREGRMDGRWVVTFAAPTLAKQNRKDAVSVPRIDRPGNPDRVAAIRLEQMGAAP